MANKKALITGITGQDGSYLVELLLEKGYEVHGIKRRSSSFNTARIDHLYNDLHAQEKHIFRLHYGDVTDTTNIIRIIQETQPDEIYNLAAQSHVRVSFETAEYCANADEILAFAEKSAESIEKQRNEAMETIITDAKYGFIEGALRETLKPSEEKDKITMSRIIDTVVTGKLLSYPIFLFAMWLTFQATFYLGDYPMQWIQMGVTSLGALFTRILPANAFRDMVVDGIIGGVGGVIIFLPNILILFFFITLMEASGYMARIAFIVDKLMHKIGLHGKSFVPMLMGFGCNVPAIMATRTIENKNDRLVTMLIIPFMSCSARYPVYILIIGAFFASYQGTILFGIYLFGIFLAGIIAWIFKKTIFKAKIGRAHV